jgi:ribosome-binding protein aMBF1 (putative translation factor)
MDASDVGRIEKGLMTPYAAQARKLASALGVRATNAGRLFEDVETLN